jgi:hypothetical protein
LLSQVAVVEAAINFLVAVALVEEGLVVYFQALDWLLLLVLLIQLRLVLVDQEDQ